MAANDAVTLSNTLFLEQKLAWNGICIEPNLEYYSSKTKSIVLNKGIYTQNVNNQDSDGVSLLRRKCKLVRAAVASPTNTKVRFDFGGPEKWAALGGIVGSNFDNQSPIPSDHLSPMRTVALMELLNHFAAPKLIDYFSLDVEGSESIVMEGFDWDYYRFSIITVERPKPILVENLLDHGYRKLRSNAIFDDELWVDASLYASTQKEWGHESWHDLPKSSCLGKKPLPKGGKACNMQ